MNFEPKTVPHPYLFLHISNNQTHIRKRVGGVTKILALNHAYPDWNSIHVL